MVVGETNYDREDLSVDREEVYMFRFIRKRCPFANMPVWFAKINVPFANWFQHANGKQFL